MTRRTGPAQLLAAQLTGPDRHLAAQTATDLAVLLPDCIPAQWWATPLGQAIARTHDPPQVVSMIEAAKILSVTRAGTYKAARRRPPQAGTRRRHVDERAQPTASKNDREGVMNRNIEVWRTL